MELKVSSSAGLTSLLEKLGVSILISTYKTSKVLIVSAADDKIRVQPKHLKKPMGITLNDDLLGIATIDSIEVFANAPRLTKNYPLKPDFYDALYLPRASYYTGTADIHDIHFGDDKLYAVNTLFSCICEINHHYSFTPIWQPSFITELRPEDRCHLNGMAMQDGRPKYVSALGSGDVKGSWRESIVDGGVLIDVESNEIVLDGLCMPHTPRFYGDKIVLLESGKGAFTVFDPSSGDSGTVDLPGFARGMAVVDDLLFITLSTMRKSSTTFGKLPVQEKKNKAGMLVYDLKSMFLLGEMYFNEAVTEIYDLAVVPARRPNILTKENEVHEHSIAAPDLYYWKTKKREQTK